MATVLVVEDERDIRDMLRRFLERAGYSVLTTGAGAEALRLLQEAQVDLVLLDLGLPDIDGSEILGLATPDVPVIVLTARSETKDRIAGLRLGADDYVVKPFSPTEVVLRVGAVLARSTGHSPQDGTRTFGDHRLSIDSGRHLVTLDGSPLVLTVTEWDVLASLADSPGRVLTRKELVNRVRGYEFEGYERVIDSHIKNLRHKLDDSEHQIVETVVGIGYRFGMTADA